MSSDEASTAGEFGRARLGDLFREGVLHIVRRPLRSLLTALASAVAIAVTVNVIGLSYGLDADTRRDLARFGRLTLDVGRLPTVGLGGKRERLAEPELRGIRAALEGVESVVVPRRQRSGTATGDVALDQVQVVAVPAAYEETLSVELAAGRFLRDDDRAVCVLDRETAKQLFPERSAAKVVGRDVTMRLGGSEEAEQTMRVVGVLRDPLTYRRLFATFDSGRGARALTSSLLSFINIYVPSRVITRGEYTGISVRVYRDADVETARERINAIWPTVDQALRPPFRTIGLFVRKDWIEEVGSTSQQNALLGNIVWLIIVGVAIVMISTLNLITIRERFDELAIRRCEGARRFDVAFQVTVEGTLTALVGGLLGLPIGYLGAAVLREIVDFPFRFELAYAGAATLVSIGLGLLASVLPARHAARLQPARVLTRRLR